MQSVSSRIWTRVVRSISYDDNHYTTGTSIQNYSLYTLTQYLWSEWLFYCFDFACFCHLFFLFLFIVFFFCLFFWRGWGNKKTFSSYWPFCKSKYAAVNTFVYDYMCPRFLIVYANVSCQSPVFVAIVLLQWWYWLTLNFCVFAIDFVL